MAKLFEEIFNERVTRLKEIAVVGMIPATPKWEGMKLEIETYEYSGTGEEPHVHLYTASHKTGNRNDPPITKIVLTEDSPDKVEDLHSIKDYPSIPKEYLQPILDWAKDSNRRNKKITNWESSLIIWDSIQDTISND